MRASRLHVPTLKETPSDAEEVSQRLLTRAGYIRKLAIGTYSYLPLASRVLQKIKEIVRQELNQVGAQELLMPMMPTTQGGSGIKATHEADKRSLQDHKDNNLDAGPAHRGVFIDAVRGDVRSWRQLPLNLYQIQRIFRDEVRPREHLTSSREVIMKDAYSFDIDSSRARASYEVMYEAYQRIFTRCHVSVCIAEADMWSLAGDRSHDFHALSERGTAEILCCSTCDFASSIDHTELDALKVIQTESSSYPVPRLVKTPSAKTISEVSAFLDIDPSAIIKTLLFYVDQEPTLVLIRGDHEVNELKVKRALDAEEVRLANEDEVRSIFGTPPGFMGPYQRPDQARHMRIVADHCLRGSRSLVGGANQLDAHIVDLDLGRDCPEIYSWLDLRRASEHDPCPRCGGQLNTSRGTHVGRISSLGTKYSVAMGCHVSDQSGRERPMEIGHYEIDITRVLATVVEQHHDDLGLIWPLSLAPFQVHVLALQMNVAEVVYWGERLYQEGCSGGLELLYDDRDVRAGGKFKDADLIGVPYRVALGGRGVKAGIAEIKRRTEPTIYRVPLDKVIYTLQREVAGEQALEQWSSL